MIHRLEPIVILSTSSSVTPMSVPVILTVVPPCNGPEAGKTLVIFAVGHSAEDVAKCAGLWQFTET